jgi:hypothetical protein
LSTAREKSAPPPVMLVAGLLAADEAPRSQAVEMLARRFGPLCYLSEPVAFPSDYYQPEMGSPLTRRTAAFLELVEACRFAEIKTACMELEGELSAGGSRRVNIDPGLLSADALILATHKHSGHRITVAQGIHAEITLWYHHGAFHPLPWTYPDFAGDELRNQLAVLRRRYLWQLTQPAPLGGTTC